jgi:hypothetical protein
MNLERFLIYIMVANPFIMAAIMAWILLHIGLAFAAAIALSGAAGWFVRGWKEDLDRDYRARNWKWP